MSVLSVFQLEVGVSLIQEVIADHYAFLSLHVDLVEERKDLLAYELAHILNNESEWVTFAVFVNGVEECCSYLVMVWLKVEEFLPADLGQYTFDGFCFGGLGEVCDYDSEVLVVLLEEWP